MKTAHVIGAGLSGLSAAVKLADAGWQVHVHEATQQIGGRCRSYFDGATGLVIDNGNHLLLSANHHARAYARAIGSEAGLVGPDKADFDFVDRKSGQRWTLKIGDGRIPAWVFDKSRRVPDTSATDYFTLAPLLWAARSRTVGEAVRCEGVLYDRLVQPLLLAALNIDPKLGSARLAANIIKETLLVGGQACRPLIARDGLSSVLIDPAVAHVGARGGSVTIGRELRKVNADAGRVASLDFGGDSVTIGEGDAVVVAVPARAAATLVPGIRAPTKFRAILNAHFKVQPPAGQPALIGVVSGLIEWLFAFHDRLSITISGADHLVDRPREELARAIWSDICAVSRIPYREDAPLPPWQIVRERRATFEATPEQDALRPGPKTQWTNLFLAGDWTDTGLPSTIEGSIRSGDRAAEHVLKTFE
jgi:squalene-associated FAD-dependent desaturase